MNPNYGWIYLLFGLYFTVIGVLFIYNRKNRGADKKRVDVFLLLLLCVGAGIYLILRGI